MKLHDIENLPFAELKARRVELVKVAIVTEVDELAARYVQARTDAKGRDEKLAEQAKTLAALQEGLEAVKEREALTTKACDEAVAAIQKESAQLLKTADDTVVEWEIACQKHLEVIENLQSNNAALVEQVTKLGSQCERLNTQAKSATEAMTTVQVEALRAVSVIQKVVTDVLGKDATDKANEGE